VEFIHGGDILAIGGMGYLATYSFDATNFTPLHEVSIAVRDFVWLETRDIVIVNQGVHGVAAYRYGDAGFKKLGEVKAGEQVGQLAVSPDGQYIAVTLAQSGGAAVYETNITALAR
jgi:Tol biopolymer transport system component